MIHDTVSIWISELSSIETSNVTSGTEIEKLKTESQTLKKQLGDERMKKIQVSFTNFTRMLKFSKLFHSAFCQKNFC